MGFSHFSPAEKKCDVGSALGSELSADFISFTPPAHSDQFWEDESGGMWMLLPSGRWYLLSLAPLTDGGYGARHGVRLLLHGPRGKRGAGECVFFLIHPLTHGSPGEAGTGPRHASPYPVPCARAVRT